MQFGAQFVNYVCTWDYTYPPFFAGWWSEGI